MNNGKKKYTKYNEKRLLDPAKVLLVKSELSNISIHATDDDKITAHLFGEAYSDKEIQFDPKNINNEAEVCVINTGLTYHGKLTVDISVPKDTCDSILIEAANNYVMVDNSIDVDTLIITGKNGNTDVSASFKQLRIQNSIGRVKVATEAKSNISIDIFGKKGDIDISAKNIRESRLTLKTAGEICNTFKPSGRYLLTGSIYNQKGEITVK